MKNSNTLRAVLEEGAVGVGYGNRTGTIATIRNLVPEQKHLTLQAVVLKRDAPVPSGDGMTIQRVLVADKTGSVNLLLFNQLIDKVCEGDTIYLENAYAALYRDMLGVYTGQHGIIRITGEMSIPFNDHPNMSHASWEFQRNEKVYVLKDLPPPPTRIPEIVMPPYDRPSHYPPTFQPQVPMSNVGPQGVHPPAPPPPRPNQGDMGNQYGQNQRQQYGHGMPPQQQPPVMNQGYPMQGHERPLQHYQGPPPNQAGQFRQHRPPPSQGVPKTAPVWTGGANQSSKSSVLGPPPVNIQPPRNQQWKQQGKKQKPPPQQW